MKSLNLYNCPQSKSISTACLLLKKSYEQSSNAIVLTSSPNIEEDLNNRLWTFSSQAFIPHGASKDPLPNKQPIYITSKYTNNPNNSNVILLLNTFHDVIVDFEKALMIFDKNNKNEYKEAIKFYKKFTTYDVKINYYSLKEDDTWENKTL